jgi:ATPase family associated with various cellular activities (AAA)
VINSRVCLSLGNELRNMSLTEQLMTIALLTSTMASISGVVLMLGLCIVYPLMYWVFGFRLTVYSNQYSEPDYQRAANHIKKTIWFQSSAIAGNDLPIGCIVGRFGFGYISQTAGDHGAVNWKIWVWGRDIPHVDQIAGNGKPVPTIDAYYDFGNLYHRKWTHQPVIVPGKPTKCQQKIIDQIIDLMKRSEYNGYGFNATVLIYGSSGTGKSQIIWYLMQQLNGTVCDSLHPLEPGSGVAQKELHATVAPTRECPLGVLLNEIDSVITSAFKGNVEVLPKFPPAIYNKGTFNDFMDDLSKFPNTVYILTTNKTKDELKAIDETAIRDGRINLFIDMDQEIRDSGESLTVAADAQKKRFKPIPEQDLLPTGSAFHIKGE